MKYFSFGTNNRHPEWRSQEGSRLLILALAFAFLLAACGDNVENTTVNQLGLEVVATEDDLPECTDDNEGEQAFVKDVDATRICIDGKWKKSDNGSGSADFSCTTKELKDKSGLKIICNGDSIGVVLNGEKGETGEKGEKGETGKTGKSGEEGSGCTVMQTDSTITVVCGEDSTTIELGARETVDDSDAVSLDSLAGYSQKGPFLKGATVYLYELDNGKTLKQTNGNFTSYITRDDGYYKFTARNLVSPYALVIVDGNYRNEVTGKVSDQPIRLKALSDVRKHHKGANVNILTHLEYEYVYNLVTKQGMNFAAAKKQAQKDVFKAFDIELEEEEDAEVLDIFGKKEGDAALLALSVLLQGDRSAADMMVLLTEISNSIAEKGAWNDSVTKASLADWALQADSEKRLDAIKKHVQDWHLGGDTTVPDFMPHIRHFINVESHLGECGENNKGVFAHVPNPKSAYFAHGYDSTDASRNSLARFVCDSVGGYHWRMAKALERDTMEWLPGNDGDVKQGKIDASMIYVYDNGWRHGTELDLLLGSGCTKTKASDSTMLQGKDSVWYKCLEGIDMTFEGSSWNVAWVQMNAIEKENLYWGENMNRDGTILTGPATGTKKVWDADSLRNASAVEIRLGRGCVSYMLDKKYLLPNGLTYGCSQDGWSQKGTFTDGRDSKVYTAVQVGNQVWMAQDLEYKDNQNGLYKGIVCIDKTSVLFIKGIANCYYLWEVAKDICPVGWHLPSMGEWELLFSNVGGQSVAGSNLRSQEDWKMDESGPDIYGFSAMPNGYMSHYISLSPKVEQESSAFFWTATESNKRIDVIKITGKDDAALLWDAPDDFYLPLRCVKD